MELIATVDELLVASNNLHRAVAILIDGCCGTQKGALALEKWDSFRKSESAAEKHGAVPVQPPTQQAQKIC